MIKKITIEATSIKPNNKEGVPYTYAEKDKKTGQPTGKKLPRTMVSIKSGDDWYMGWSYKTGSAAEALKVGDVAELLIEETPDSKDPSKIWKNWKFPKQEDKDAQKIKDLEAQLAAMSASPAPQIAKMNAPVASNPSASTEPEF